MLVLYREYKNSTAKIYNFVYMYFIDSVCVCMFADTTQIPGIECKLCVGVSGKQKLQERSGKIILNQLVSFGYNCQCLVVVVSV